MDESARRTSLMEIREFLADHQCAPAPWESPDSVLDYLYAALCARQKDKQFWSDLKILVDRLEDQRLDRTAFAGSLAFKGGALSNLVDDMQQTLGNGGSSGSGRPSLRKWIRKTVTVTALFSFVLLGMAVGCNSDDENSSGDNGNSAAAIEGDDDDNNGSDPYYACDDAEENYISGTDSGVYCELVEVIKEADISNSYREALLDCLPGLDWRYREELLEMFNSMSDVEISEYLEQPSEFCLDPYDEEEEEEWGDDDDH